MKSQLITVIILWLLPTILFSGMNRTESISEKGKGSVTFDPSSGEQVAADQLMLAFEKNAAPEIIDQVIKNNNLNILSFSPALKIYHVQVSNRTADFQFLKDIQNRLQAHPIILYVNLCKINPPIDKNLSPTDQSGPSRKGQITMSHYSIPAFENRPLTAAETIQQHKPALINCIGRNVKIAKKIKGYIKFQIIVSADGEVKRASIIKTTISERKFVQCVLNKIRTWKDFPVSKNETVIKFTFEI